ncbi:hypothetical protein Ancab_035564 [Ancistrocladus abbreviatus]
MHLKHKQKARPWEAWVACVMKRKAEISRYHQALFAATWDGFNALGCRQQKVRGTAQDSFGTGQGYCISHAKFSSRSTVTDETAVDHEQLASSEPQEITKTEENHHEIEGTSAAKDALHLSSRIRATVATGPGAAAAHAQLLADQEEREIEYLIAMAVETQQIDCLQKIFDTGIPTWMDDPLPNSYNKQRAEKQSTEPIINTIGC